jgi:hypothetical protein
MEFIFFYSIGRSGTAYLAQVLGHKEWKPKDIAYPDKNVSVVHERWGMKQNSVEQLKLLKPKSKEGMKIQEKKVKSILAFNKSRGIDRVVITDTAFGRWCPYYIIKNYDYKAVLLDRNKGDVIESWLNRYRQYAKKTSKVQSKELVQTRFKYNYFNITDKYTLLHVDKALWKKYSLAQRFGWFYDEYKAKWEDLKSEMDPKKYFETSYEKIITVPGMDELSQFLNLSYSKKLMDKRVNNDEKG